jgi:hypothetical protein
LPRIRFILTLTDFNIHGPDNERGIPHSGEVKRELLPQDSEQLGMTHVRCPEVGL